MRLVSLRVACVLALVARCAHAQAGADTPLQLTPDSKYVSVNYVTRMGAGIFGETECLMEYAAAVFRGAGSSDASTCKISGIELVLQDEERLSRDSYRLVVRRPVAPNGLPDASAAGAIMLSGPIQAPPSTGSGAIVWHITMSFQTEVRVPCETGFWCGVSLPPATSQSDLLLVGTSNEYDGSTVPPTGDNPRASRLTFHCAGVEQPAGVATRSATQRTLAIAALTKGAALSVGNVDASKLGYRSFGLGGTYPAIKSGSRDDGLRWRIWDEAARGGLAAPLLAARELAGGLTIAGFAGALWLAPPLITLDSATIPPASAGGQGIAEGWIAVPGSVPALVGASVWVSGLTVGIGLQNPRIANARRVSL